MMLWWKELALQKLVARQNPKDFVVWLEPQNCSYETIEILGVLQSGF